MIYSKFTIVTFYQFKKIHDISIFKNTLSHFCKFNKIKGTIILAKEGINGTIAGMPNSIKEFENLIIKMGLNDHNPKYSYLKYMPFFRLKVREKKEIVTLRTKIADPESITGNKIKPDQWNQFITKDDTILIDVRNDFEVKMGTFKGSVNPNTKSFTEFKAYLKNNLEDAKNKKIAMFCTGGIRCEKASSFMKNNGFNDVYHLKGGILKYLENIPENESMWQGECFVFDDRVSVNHKLMPGTYDMCHGCRMPITDNDKLSHKYIKGVACPKCFDTTSEEQKSRYKSRQKQVELSNSRNERHIGPK